MPSTMSLGLQPQSLTSNCQYMHLHALGFTDTVIIPSNNLCLMAVVAPSDSGGVDAQCVSLTPFSKGSQQPRVVVGKRKQQAPVINYVLFLVVPLPQCSAHISDELPALKSFTQSPLLREATFSQVSM